MSEEIGHIYDTITSRREAAENIFNIIPADITDSRAYCIYTSSDQFACNITATRRNESPRPPSECE